MNRRDFMKTGTLACAGAALGASCSGKEQAVGQIMTVNGPISPGEMGFTLTHEHVLVDFIGAKEVSPDRYDRDEAFKVILPHLEQARDLGCETFVECTPSYIGKDARLCKMLADETGLKILTNTGFYGAAEDKFVPSFAYDESADQLADRWTKEWEEGIDGTDIRPGFIKVGVDRESLSEIDRKLVEAAAITHKRTGLLILAHTGYATPAMEEIALLKALGVHPSAWVWTHAQNEKDNGTHEQAAREGAWIAFDGVRANRLERDVNHLKEMKGRGCLENVLISHDAGWYRPGEPNGGNYRPHEDLFTALLPALRENGFTEAEIHMLTVVNPRRAFRVEVREA